MTCETCRWGERRDGGTIYCTVNLYVHQYNPPDTECNCRDVAGSRITRHEPKAS